MSGYAARGVADPAVLHAEERSGGVVQKRRVGARGTQAEPENEG